MAEAKGYICDNCGSFVASPGNGLPPKWIRLTPSCLKFKQEPGFAERPIGEPPHKTESFDVCSNVCGIRLLLKRAEAEGEKVEGVSFRKQRSDAGQSRKKEQ